jgi:peptide-methionine (R)-S-oxide reductase
MINFSKLLKRFKININKAELKQRLSSLEYNITQEKGTERPYTGEYLHNKEEGMYHCIVCDNQLFSSKHKFDSGCGWPAFFDKAGGIAYKEDKSYGMNRVEVTCDDCDSHLGHVFEDGPYKKRYCINSSALDFRKI